MTDKEVYIPSFMACVTVGRMMSSEPKFLRSDVKKWFTDPTTRLTEDHYRIVEAWWYRGRFRSYKIYTGRVIRKWRKN